MPEQGEYVFFNFILATNNLLQHIPSAKQPNLATGLTVHTPLYKPVQAVQTYPTLVSIILPLYKSVQAV